jgi:hypothetical protein
MITNAHQRRVNEFDVWIQQQATRPADNTWLRTLPSPDVSIAPIVSEKQPSLMEDDNTYPRMLADLALDDEWFHRHSTKWLATAAAAPVVAIEAYLVDCLCPRLCALASAPSRTLSALVEQLATSHTHAFARVVVPAVVTSANRVSLDVVASLAKAGHLASHRASVIACCVSVASHVAEDCVPIVMALVDDASAQQAAAFVLKHANQHPSSVKFGTLLNVLCSKFAEVRPLLTDCVRNHTSVFSRVLSRYL